MPTHRESIRLDRVPAPMNSRARVRLHGMNTTEDGRLILTDDPTGHTLMVLEQSGTGGAAS
jgi:hypothetical protein